MHAVENAAVHGFKPVAGVGKRAAHDGRQRIGEITLLERLAQVDVNRRYWRRRRRRNGFGHGPGLAAKASCGKREDARTGKQKLAPPPGRGDSCAGSNGSSLDCGRVSHLGMDDQSIRSKGETLRPIERLAGSGHCARTPRPRSPATAPDEGRRCGMRVMAKAAPALVERERAAMIDQLPRVNCPKSRHADAAQFRAMLSPPCGDSIDELIRSQSDWR